jgi:hypothetical protein
MDPLDRVDRLRAHNYVSACQAISTRITPNQWTMLIGHATARRQTLSMKRIASFGN